MRPRFFPLAILAVLVCVGWAPSLKAVDFLIQSSQGADPAKVVLGINQEFSANAVIKNALAEPSSAIQGFQMAISHDAEVLKFVSATWQGTALEAPQLRGGQGPEFFKFQETASGGIGITLGVVFELEALSFSLGAGDHRVAKLNYQAIRITGAQESSIAFAESLGNPAVQNRYSTLSPGSLAPAAKIGLKVQVLGERIYSINFTAAAVTADPAASRDLVVPIQLQNNPLPVSGFSFGVSHEGQNLKFKELRFAGGLTAVLGGPPGGEYPFYSLNASPPGGTGFTAALLLSERDAQKTLDPVLSPHHIFDAVYEILGAPGTRTSLSITGELGSPKVPVILDLGGAAQAPLLPSQPPPTRLEVTIRSAGAEVPFKRGDVDQNGDISITDAINILRYIFTGGLIANPKVLDTIRDCLVAFNVDGSQVGGQEAADSIDLTDAINYLTYQFAGGVQPPEPFLNCGINTQPQADAIRCRFFDCQ